MLRNNIKLHLLRLTLLTFAVGALFSCAAISPSASPKDAEWVRNKASQYQKGNRNLGATKDQRQPLRAGQWVAVLQQSKSDPNEVILQITKVAAVLGDTATLENEMYSSLEPGQRTAVQQRIRGLTKNAKLVYQGSDAEAALNSLEIESVKIMDKDGNVQELPNMGLNIGQLSSQLLKSNIAVGEVRSEPCETQYIKASRCLAVPFEVKVLWMTETGTTYAHSEIPVIGYIKSESDKVRTEVIGYGMSGAEILIR